MRSSRSSITRAILQWADGTVYFSMHPFDEPKHKVMKLNEDGLLDRS